MSLFTIETSYHLPIYRYRMIRADTLEDACRLAVQDPDWRFERRDYACAGATYVAGAWSGLDITKRAAYLSIPPQFRETEQRKADHFPVLLARLKDSAAPDDAAAQGAIAKAEAILAGKPDPA
jgi:hypothetical protein